MALFKSGNPTLNDKTFNNSTYIDFTQEGVMTVRGTMNKFGFLMLTVIAGAVFNWHLYDQQNYSLSHTLMLVGLFGGLGIALLIVFKKNLVQYVAPAYGLLEGLMIGGISAIVNDELKEKYPGVIIQAVGLTFGVAIAMYLLYNFKIIKATQRLKSIVITATLGVVIFYLIDMILFYGFNFDVPLTSWNNSSWIAIGFSLLMIILASLNLIIDFDMIEKGAESGAPKNMEWYGAFALLVTIVWLYIEMLKLLMRFANRK